MSAWWVTGDTLNVLRQLPDASVDLVMGSPPFLALRSYLPGDDPAKQFEMGSEDTPGEYIDALLDVTEELARVLTPTGTLVFELGDTYAGSGGSGGDYTDTGLRAGQAKFAGTANQHRKLRRLPGDYPNRDDNPRPSRNGRKTDRRREVVEGICPPRERWKDERDGWPADKSLCLIPELFRFALVYGFNPLTGRETQRWRVRNVIRWVRTNPPVGALGDKFRPATSDLVVACAAPDAGRHRYFDLDAVRLPPARDYEGETREGDRERDRQGRGRVNTKRAAVANPGGSPPLDWWLISPRGYKGSHYAVFPPELCVKPIEAMCPHRVCLECGEPSRRLTATTNAVGKAVARTRSDAIDINAAPDRAIVETLGWTCCGHGPGCQPTTRVTAIVPVEQGQGPDGKWHDIDEWPFDTDPAATRVRRKKKRVLGDIGACAQNHWRAGRVLDPFAGTGTTGLVATGHGRDFIGIDLDVRNVDLACERIGPLLFQHVDVPELATHLARLGEPAEAVS